MQIATQAWSNGEWWIAISLASGFFIFIFWIIKTAIEARKKISEGYDPFYEPYPCKKCGNYTLWGKGNGLIVCDCCGYGMKKELDENGKEC